MMTLLKLMINIANNHLIAPLLSNNTVSHRIASRTNQNNTIGFRQWCRKSMNGATVMAKSIFLKISRLTDIPNFKILHYI